VRGVFLARYDADKDEMLNKKEIGQFAKKAAD
jgi:hypothetical protein